MAGTSPAMTVVGSAVLGAFRRYALSAAASRDRASIVA
jgi:hypothetical protein